MGEIQGALITIVVSVVIGFVGLKAATAVQPESIVPALQPGAEGFTSGFKGAISLAPIGVGATVLAGFAALAYLYASPFRGRR